jgi:hypothetical protein
MLNSEEVNVIGQICNDTWGDWSTKTSPSTSIKVALSGDVLECRYTAIVTLPGSYHDKHVIDMNKDQSVQITDKYMKGLRKQFKESAGRPLKVKQLGTNDSLEMITVSPHSPKKNAYYRRNTSFRIE